MEPVVFPTGVLEEFLKNSNVVFIIIYEKLNEKSSRTLLHFYFHVDASDGNT